MSGGVKIKICGMTCPEDIELVNALGVDMAGFVMFFPKSRRNLSLERAAELAAGLKGIKSAAVTVSPTAEQARAIERAGFDFLQVHGELSEEMYNSTGLPIIRAFNDFGIAELVRCSRLERVKAFLFDAAEPGSGKLCDRDKLTGLPLAGRELILAGGLTPDNVSEAIARVRPNMVDVSSGVERREGGKDPELARRFVEAVRVFSG